MTNQQRGYANTITPAGRGLYAKMRAEFPADPEEFRAAVTPALLSTTVRELADEMGTTPDQVRCALEDLYDETPPSHDDCVLAGFQAAAVVKWYDQARDTAEQWDEGTAAAI